MNISGVNAHCYKDFDEQSRHTIIEWWGIVAEEKRIVDTLKKNGYPLRFIHTCAAATYPEKKMTGGLQGLV